MTQALDERIDIALAAPVAAPISRFATQLAEHAGGAAAMLFYGSNLRTGSLEGVLDFYVLTRGPEENGIWPRVSYHEWDDQGRRLRAKVATMSLAKFARAARGELTDTTIWARFVQPRALVWAEDGNARREVVAALAGATATAAKLAVALGPASAFEEDYWTTLFCETYRAEFRIEDGDRAASIVEADRVHFSGLLALGLDAAGIGWRHDGDRIEPLLDAVRRKRILGWWRNRRRLGKPLNLLRLLKASATFDGAARYAAWKIERHTGVPVEVTPWREKHPVLAAPGVLFSIWRHRKRG